jgi:hypothetical protein
MSNTSFNAGDRIEVIEGKMAGRKGKFIKHCSKVFPEYGRIKLDLKGREKEAKVLMIKKSEIKLLP